MSQKVFFWNSVEKCFERSFTQQHASKIDNSTSLCRNRSKHVDQYDGRGQNNISFPCYSGQTMKEIHWKYVGNDKLEQPGYFSVDFLHQSRINLSDRISANPSYLSDPFQTCICTGQPVKRTSFSRKNLKPSIGYFFKLFYEDNIAYMQYIVNHCKYW